MHRFLVTAQFDDLDGWLSAAVAAGIRAPLAALAVIVEHRPDQADGAGLQDDGQYGTLAGLLFVNLVKDAVDRLLMPAEAPTVH